MDLSRFLNRLPRRCQSSGKNLSLLLTAVLLLLIGCDNPKQAAPFPLIVTVTPTALSSNSEDFDFPTPPSILHSSPTQEKSNNFVTLTAPSIVTSNEGLLAATQQIIPSSTVTKQLSAPFTVLKTPKPTQTFTPVPTETAIPLLVNGLPEDNFIIFPDNARKNVREIFSFGQTLGRNPNAFSKLGDSVTLTDHYLTRFDSGDYVLGLYESLQSTIDHFNGSFGRYGVATKVGLHAWSIFDPLWASDEWCAPEENMVACEVRLYNPSIFLIKIGSNDNGAAAAFDQNVRQLVEYLISNGVVPVLGTKADRFEGPDDRNNKMIRQIASEYEIPLWDYDQIARTLVRRGLSGDDIHLTMADSNDYTDPKTFERGYPVNDLTALIMLQAIWEEVKVSNDS